MNNTKALQRETIAYHVQGNNMCNMLQLLLSIPK